MIRSLLRGTILGGLTAFLWSSLSWELLGWHEKAVHPFPNEDEVTAAISSRGVQSGVYLLPSVPSRHGLTVEQAKAAQAAVMDKYQKGPIMLAAIRTGGFGSYPRAMAIQLLSLMAAASLLTWLLLQTTDLSYGRRVLFLAVAGLAASVIADVPNWNWWGFSGTYTAVNLVDFTLTWFFAGLVIAKVARPRASHSALPTP
jgi:hypothetical protein